MKLVEFVPPKPHPLWKLCLQMGITDVIVKVNPSLTGLPDPWRFETLSQIVNGLKDAGLRIVGLEGDPFDMTPIKNFGAGGVTDAAREETLAHYCELLESMGRLGIRLLCYNFMPGTGWARTGVREGRGGAKATYFSLREVEMLRGCDVEKQPLNLSTPQRLNSSTSQRLNVSTSQRLNVSTSQPLNLSTPQHLNLSSAQVWSNYEHFIKSVLPTAERWGVRMGLHPDDPCLPSLGGYARIFGSVEAYDRAYALCPSPSNAVTFCQANFKLMGADLETTARHFGDRIAFIHVRDVEGDKTDFTELFHDQGTTDQFALMRVYRSLGLDVPVRGDHVPEMEGDRLLDANCIPGYFTMGRLFANGYLKALLKGA